MKRHVQSSIRLSVIALILAGCAPWGDHQNVAAIDESDVVFLVQEVAPNAIMDALYVGEVSVDDAGCLRLAAPDYHTVVWPLGFTLEESGDALRVLDGAGAEAGRIGGTFRLGGGEVVVLHEGVGLSAAARANATALCPGRFWIVGDVLVP